MGLKVGCCDGFGVGANTGDAVGLPGDVVGAGVGSVARMHDM